MIERESYLEKIRPFIDGELIKVLTGVRRSGKSVLLELIKKEIMIKGIKEEQCITYNFENMSYNHLLEASLLHKEITKKAKEVKGKLYLFFDEIQEVKDWEKAINSFRVEFDCDIYITGSNAKLLSSELSTYLSGRYISFVIYPFSFREYLKLYKETNLNTDIRDLFSKYLTLGGMPYIKNLNFEENSSKAYLKELYSAVLLKDVIQRNNIRDVDLLERIILYLMKNISTTFSATSISKYFKSEGRTVAPETILNYIKACEAAFLIYKIKREDLQGKKMLTVNEKYYIADVGIREAIFESNTQDINLVLENIVCIELLRRGYNVTVGKYGEKEIDFIATKGKEKIYIQVTYILASPETIEREFSVLENIRDNFPKYVISLDEFDMGRNGIIHKNIRNFLLEDTF